MAGAPLAPAAAEMAEGAAPLRRAQAVAGVETDADEVTARLPRGERKAAGEIGVGADVEAEVGPAPAVGARVVGPANGRVR